MNRRYDITKKLVLPELASSRYSELSRREYERDGARVIGGDLGDLEFYGYTLNRGNGTTTLDGPVLVTQRKLSKKDANQIAYDVLMESYGSIGIETVEHS